jgi:protoporphyrinogen oxidase
MEQAWIIGSGPAGLCMAYHLHQLGVPCTVISADDGPGGLARPRWLANQVVDPGPHSFYASYASEAFAILHALFAADELHHLAPRKLIRTDEFMSSVPPRPTDLLQPGLVFDAASMVAQSWFRHGTSADHHANASERVLALRGRTFHRVLFETWCRKQFGVGPELLDAGLVDLLALTRRSGGSEALVHPRSGAIGELWTRLAERLAQEGVRFRYREAVRGMSMQADRVTAISTSTETIPVTGHVFTSTPLQSLVSWMGSGTRTQTAVRSTVLLLFTVSECRRHELYLTDHCLDEPLGRLTFCDNWRAAAQRRERSVLCAEFWCSPGEPIHDATADQLLEHVERYLHRTRLAVVDARAQYERIGPIRTTPVPLIGYRQQQIALQASLPTLLNLHPIGRHAAHRWDGVDDAIVETQRLAQTYAHAAS